MDFLAETIITERLILKILDESYADTVLEYHLRNRLFFKEWDPIRSEEFYTLAYQKQLLNNELANIKSGTMFKLWIIKQEEEASKRIIGFVSLNNIVRGAFQSCHLGYKLDKDELNKGYITEAIKKIIPIAFNDLELHRIEANIMPKNKASLRVVNKLGFYDEGIAKKYLKINGRWEDHIHMVLLDEDME